jgi:hypothetical protein
VAGEHGNNIFLTPIIVVGTFLDQMRDCRLLRNESSNEVSTLLNILGYVSQNVAC